MSSSQETLQRAIEKAIEGGWDTAHFTTLKSSYKHPDESEFHDILGDWHMISPLDVIYNHDFAKSLWGEDLSYAESKGARFSSANITRKPLLWQHHLQQMVISPNPIEYLGANL